MVSLAEVIQPFVCRLYTPYKKYRIAQKAPSFSAFKQGHNLKHRQEHSVLELYLNEQKDRFYYSAFDRDETVKAFLTLFGKEGKEKLLADAESVMRHEFDLLGADLKFDKHINWRLDAKSGRQWPLEKSQDIPLYHPDNSDIKVLWEISRFQHLIPLGKAYWLTGDEKYVGEFVGEIESWIADNPVGYGPNWSCAMEVAIRAVNWICAFQFFCMSPTTEEKFWEKFIYTLYLHGYEIANHLEVRRNKFGFFVNNNHFMADLCGLIYLGLFFRSQDMGEKWLQLSLSDFRKEILCQINIDGCNFESSTNYHRLVLEFISYTIILLAVNEIEMPDSIIHRLFKMFQFVGSYLDQKGKAPQIGDMDDGRFIIFGKYSHWDRPDHSYLLDLGSFLFNGQPFNEENSFWLSRNYKNICPRVRKFESAYISKAFKESGYYILRNKESHMIVSAGMCGTGKRGNHKHNDTFSFSLSRKGSDLIVDPGSYIYAADIEMRNLFRSTRYHNTLQIGRYEINPFDQKILFRLEEYANPKILKWKTTDSYDFLVGIHSGYCQKPLKVIHRRSILFNKKNDYWIVEDRLIMAEHQKIKEPVFLRFHLAANASFVPEARDIQILPQAYRDMNEFELGRDAVVLSELHTIVAFPDGQTMHFVPFVLPEMKVEKKIEEGFISPSYGKKMPAEVIVFKTISVTGCFNFTTLILADG